MLWTSADATDEAEGWAGPGLKRGLDPMLILLVLVPMVLGGEFYVALIFVRNCSETLVYHTCLLKRPKPDV